ncbi:MAG TPA: hypothetical protein VGQ90_16750 [Stellaceae bacterium]|nr:hypothetical protein [Stellaceae bacterium]
MNKLLCGLLLTCILFGTAACGSINETVGNSIGAGSPDSALDDADLQVYRSYFSPAVVMDCIRQVRATPERRSCRDLIAYARMRYIDIKYQQYRHRVFAAVNGGNAATDIAVLGLNAAGTLVPGATTKAILHAISGGLVGAKGIIDKDILYNAGIQTLILKMDADRAAVRERITSHLKQNEEVYPFEAAELDTGDYYRVGTLHNALITLQGDAGATLKKETAAANETPATPRASPPAAVAFSAATQPAAPVVPAPAAPSPPPAASPLPAPVTAVVPVVPQPAVAPSGARTTGPVHLGPLPAKVNAALVKLTRFIRFQATKPQLDQVIVILGLGPGSDRGRIAKAISDRVTDPARANEQMIALSDLLLPALGQSFRP